MAEVVQLPPLVVLKLAGYVYFENESDSARGFVNFGGDSVFEPYAKIEVENARINNNYVHLRFSASNKYWGRQPDPNSSWLFAGSNQPEEDVSKQSCTMFEPKYSEGTVYLTHVQSGWVVGYASSGRLLFEQSSDGSPFSFVNWASLVKLPKRVAFKAANGKYVRQSGVYLQASSTDGNGDESIFEVQLQPDGHLRIKTMHNRFWGQDGDWMRSDSQDQTKDTLFWPIRVNGTTVALQNAGNGHFIRLTDNDDYLSAAEQTMTNQTKFVVEELVLERKLYNVRYRMEDARIFNETAILVTSLIGENETDIANSQSLASAFQETTSHTFTNSFSVQLGVKTEFTAGFPFIADAKIEVSAEVTTSFEWSKTTTETKTSSATYVATIPPRSKVVVNYVATKGTCSVPFSYTQQDQSSTDGQMVTSEHTDGICTGVSYYNHHFTEPAYTPIP